MRALGLPSLDSVVDSVKLVRGTSITVVEVFKKDARFYVRGVCADHGDFTSKLKSLLDPAVAGCPKCNIAARGKAIRYNVDDVAARAKLLHGEKYTYGTAITREGTVSYINLVCPAHGVSKVAVSNLLGGSGCKSCGQASGGLKIRVPFAAWVQRSRIAHGDRYEYGSVNYESSRAELTVRCKIHGEFTVGAKSHVNAGAGCLACWREVGSKSLNVKPDEHYLRNAEESLKSRDHLSLVGVTSSGTERKVVINCTHHGVFETKFHDMAVKKTNCPRCANGSHGNKLTQALAKILDDLGVAYELESKLAGDRRRWDLFIPEHKLAIEADGVYWHSSALKKGRWELTKKALAVAPQGITQINFWEDEIVNKPEILHSILKYRLGLGKTVGARTCTKGTATASEAKVFLNKYHLQGFCSGSSYPVLLLDGQIVALAVFSARGSGRAGRKSDSEMVLERYASSVSVSGGFSRLLKDTLRQNTSVRKVVTYSDSRVFTGKLYASCGFVASAQLPPDYCYVKNSERVSKRARQKAWFELESKKGKVLYDPHLTERELAELNGMYQLYDRGKVRWELSVP